METKLDLVTIRMVQGELSAQVIKSRLESEGIPAIIGCETYFNLIIGVYTPFSIAVPRQYAENANMIVEDSEGDLIRNIPRIKIWSVIFALLTIFSRY